MKTELWSGYRLQIGKLLICVFFSVFALLMRHMFISVFLLFVVVSVTTKPVICSTGIFVAIANNTLYGSMSNFFITKIIRILNKDHVP